MPDRLRLRDFRNYSRLDVDLTPGFHLLLGGNAQGRTNILEAIDLLATLRSFRSVGGGIEITRLRHELIPKISPLARLAYRRISNDAEELKLEYRPSVCGDFAGELAARTGPAAAAMGGRLRRTEPPGARLTGGGRSMAQRLDQGGCQT